MSNTENQVLVDVRELTKWFPVKKWFFEKPSFVKAVDGVSFTVQKGETLGIVGESGCGKSTLLRTVLRLIEPSSGSVSYDGVDITKMSSKPLRRIREHMQIVFQDPYSALDSRMRVGDIIEEPLIINRLYQNKTERRERVLELMEQVGLNRAYVDRYPHEFSGGQRQRIVIARALATNPQLLLCDEAVSALDVSVRAQILNLLEELQDRLKLTYIFVSHDLSVVEHICDRVIIMYLGRIVEMGTKEEIFNNPQHPYTKALLSSIPMVGQRRSKNRILLEGDIPSPVDPPVGCRFHTRCPYAEQRCRQEQSLQPVTDSHFVACWRCTAAENAASADKAN